MKTLRIFTTFLIAFAFALTAYAQDRTVTGRVTDEGGEGLPGATIQIKGTTIGTISDLDGNYNIEVSAEAETLVASFTGYKSQEEEIGSRSVINFVLAEGFETLREVVVSAIGIERDKRSLGYATTEVSNTDIVNANDANITSSLAGKVPGLIVMHSSGAPGAGSQIRIRGSSTLGNNNPLYVVDGVPVNGAGFDGVSRTYFSTGGVELGNDAMDFNMADVESVNVLKGGAATALYGLRGGNGVILITTKKGKKGGRRFQLGFNSSITLGTVTGVPVHNQTYSQGWNNRFGGPNGARTKNADGTYTYGRRYYNASGTLWRTTNVSYGPPVDHLVFVKDPVPVLDKNGNPVLDANGNPTVRHISRNPYDRRGRIMSRYDYNKLNAADRDALQMSPMEPKDNSNNFYQTAWTHQNTLSLSGSTDRSSYYFSLGYLHEGGVNPKAGYYRISSAANFEYAFTPEFKMTTNVKYTNARARRIQRGSNISGIELSLYRTPASFDVTNGFTGRDKADNPLTYLIPQTSSGKSTDNTPTNEQRRYHGYDNPYYTVNKTRYRDEGNRLVGSLTLDYLITPEFSVQARAGLDVHAFSAVSTYSLGSAESSSGEILDSRSAQRSFNTDLLLTYDRDLDFITEDLAVKLIVGHNFYNAFSRTTQAEGTGLILYDYYSLANAKNFDASGGNPAGGTLRRHSAFFDVGLSYGDMAFVNVTGRNTWSSRLPSARSTSFFPGSIFYPSVTGSFVFSELIDENPVFSFGKVRLSWAQTGVDAPGFATATTFGVSSAGDGWTNGVSFPFLGSGGYEEGNTAGNDKISGEVTTTYEVGTELGFWDNRVNLDYTYFWRVSKDQAHQAEVSRTSGFSAKYINAGEINARGMEISLGFTPIRTQDWNWSMNLTYYNLTNTVVDLPDGVEEIFLGGFTGSQGKIKKGFNYAVLFGSQARRTKSGQLIVNRNTGRPTSAAQVLLADPNPAWTGGWRNTVSWKGLSLSFLFEAKIGHYRWNGTRHVLGHFGVSKLVGKYRDKRVRISGVYFKEGLSKSLDDGSEDNYETLSSNKAPTTILDGSWFTSVGGGFGGPGEFTIQNASHVRMRELTLSYQLPKSLFDNINFLSSASVSLTANNLFIITPFDGGDGLDPDLELTASGGLNAQGLHYFQGPATRTYTLSLRLSF